MSRISDIVLCWLEYQIVKVFVHHHYRYHHARVQMIKLFVPEFQLTTIWLKCLNFCTITILMVENGDILDWKTVPSNNCQTMFSKEFYLKVLCFKNNPHLTCVHPNAFGGQQSYTTYFQSSEYMFCNNVIMAFT